VVRPLRLGPVPYLNVAPIVHGLAGDARFRIEPDVPSRVAERLRAGELDLAMLPSIEYAARDYAIVPGIAIASRGPVRSVSLFHRTPLETVRCVAIDTSSLTSVALLRILLQERLGREPKYVPMPPDVSRMLEAADAALVIGDPALRFTGEAGRLDLGDEWTKRTGLPFVYAFWAGPPGIVTAEDVETLQASLRAGLASLGAIAAAYNGHGMGYAADNETYLRSNIVYDLGEGELQGLVEFYRRARTLGLISRVPELRFHGRS
jgi:chorismate dehydratase